MFDPSANPRATHPRPWSRFQIRVQTGKHVALRYPPLAALPVLVPALITLAAARLISSMPWESESLWPTALGLWSGLTALKVGWLLWWSTVEFDRERALVRRGPEAIGRLRDLVAIQHQTTGRTGLYLVFHEERSVPRRWRLPFTGAADEARIGARLADELGISFERR